MSNWHGSSAKEISAIMRAVARDNSWNKKKQKFMTRRVVCGISLYLFDKHKKKENPYSNKENGWLTLTGRDWSIQLFVSSWPGETGSDPGFCHYPRYREMLYAKVMHDIVNPNGFKRDLTLLRMFSSEWNEK